MITLPNVLKPLFLLILNTTITFSTIPLSQTTVAAQEEKPVHVIIIAEQSLFLSNRAKKNIDASAEQIAESTLSQEGNLFSMVWAEWYEADSWPVDQPTVLGPTDDLDLINEYIDNHSYHSTYLRLDLAIDFAYERILETIDTHQIKIFIFSTGLSAYPYSSEGKKLEKKRAGSEGRCKHTDCRRKIERV